MIVRVLGNQIVGPDFVGGHHEFTSVDHIARWLCSGGGGCLANSSHFSPCTCPVCPSIHSIDWFLDRRECRA